MLNINEILELIKSNKINESDIDSKDLIKIEFYKKKLNEDALHLPKELDETIDLISNAVWELKDKEIDKEILKSLSDELSSLINKNIFIKNPLLSKNKISVSLTFDGNLNHYQGFSGSYISDYDEININLRSPLYLSKYLNNITIIDIKNSIEHELTHFYDFLRQSDKDNTSIKQSKDKRANTFENSFHDSLYYYRDTEMQSYSHDVYNNIIHSIFFNYNKSNIRPILKKILSSFLSYIETYVKEIKRLNLNNFELLWLRHHYNQRENPKIKFDMINLTKGKKGVKYIDGRKVWKKILKYIHSLLYKFYENYTDEEYQKFLKKYFIKKHDDFDIPPIPPPINYEIPEPPSDDNYEIPEPD